MVWRQLGNLDDLSAVLPGSPAGRLQLRAFQRHPPDAAATTQRARGIAGPRPDLPADHPERGMEADGARVAGVADPWRAGLYGRRAVPDPVDHHAADAGVVRPGDAGCVAVPLLRALESGFTSRPPQLSVRRRAKPDAASAGLPLVDAVRRLRGPRKLVRLAGSGAVGCASPRNGGGRFTACRASRPLRSRAVARAADVRLGDAPGDDERDVAGRRGGPVPLGSATEPVPRVVHDHVRQPSVVLAAAVGRPPADLRRRRLHGYEARRRPSASAPGGRVLRRGSRLLHGAARRAGQVEAAS